MIEEFSPMAEREKFEIIRAKFLYVSQVLDSLKAEYRNRLNPNEDTIVFVERNRHAQCVKELMEKFIAKIYQEIGLYEPMQPHFEVFTATLKEVQPDTGAVSDPSIYEFLGSHKYTVLWETILAELKSGTVAKDRTNGLETQSLTCEGLVYVSILCMLNIMPAFMSDLLPQHYVYSPNCNVVFLLLLL